jgi:hypothetical protein
MRETANRPIFRIGDASFPTILTLVRQERRANNLAGNGRALQARDGNSGCVIIVAGATPLNAGVGDPKAGRVN